VIATFVTTYIQTKVTCKKAKRRKKKEKKKKKYIWLIEFLHYLYSTFKGALVVFYHANPY